jgi:hypothetical protein
MPLDCMGRPRDGGSRLDAMGQGSSERAWGGLSKGRGVKNSSRGNPETGVGPNFSQNPKSDRGVDFDRPAGVVNRQGKGKA